MNGIGKNYDKNNKPSIEASENIPKVSKIVFDEKTGTVTLTIASEEEIAEAEKLKEGKG